MTCHTEIAFIDRGISEIRRFVAGLRPEIEPVLLDGTESGLKQMSQALATRRVVSSIHIVAHGAPGEFHIGDGRVDAEALPQPAEEIGAIGRAVRRGGRILVWSCSVAAGTKGARFVQRLAEGAGAHVAAAPYPVGAAELGGLWALVGADETERPLTEAAASTYAGLMAVTAAKLTKITTDSGSSASDFYTNDTTL